MYGTLAMLYASHVLEGKRTIKQVPESIREVVTEIIVESTKKQDVNE